MIQNFLMLLVVVGGGPTSIEFTCELSDFINQDVMKYYTDLKLNYEIVVVEAAKHLLGTFDAKLSSYVEKQMLKRRVTTLNEEAVKHVKDVSVVLGSGKEIPFGVCVWSTGKSGYSSLINTKPITIHSSKPHSLLYFVQSYLESHNIETKGG